MLSPQRNKEDQRGYGHRGLKIYGQQEAFLSLLDLLKQFSLGRFAIYALQLHNRQKAQKRNAA